MNEYNGSRISFLSEASKKMVSLTQKINTILGMVNNQDSFEVDFDFSEAVELFKTGNYADLDGFCCDETLSKHMVSKGEELQTREDREIYYLALRNHILDLKDNGEL